MLALPAIMRMFWNWMPEGWTGSPVFVMLDEVESAEMELQPGQPET
jgi:hypothetical protein